MKVVKFVGKFAFAAFLLWVFLLVMSLVIWVVDSIFTVVVIGLVALCAYLVITGKYKALDEFFDAIIEKVKEFADKEEMKTENKDAVSNT